MEHVKACPCHLIVFITTFNRKQFKLLLGTVLNTVVSKFYTNFTHTHINIQCIYRYTSPSSIIHVLTDTHIQCWRVWSTLEQDQVK